LTVLKYINIPKANVIQTMTTPKNWTQMLQILAFLCHNCQVIHTNANISLIFNLNTEIQIFKL